MASAYYKLRMLRKKRAKKKKKIAEETDNNTNNTSVNTCRVCLKDGNIPIYGPSDVSEAIRTFGDVEISEDDDYPKHLCEACHSLLQSAILFRKSAKSADLMLRQSLVDPPDLQAESEVSDVSNENFCDDSYDDNKLKSYNCKLCKLNFESWDELMTHRNSKQHKRVRIQCPVCYRLFTAQLYKRHLLRHQSATHLVCDVCGKLYRKDNLIRHLQLHSYDLPFQCQTCPYRGRFLESLKIHMRTHTGDKPFSCDNCELRFLTRSNLNRHLLTHKKDRPHQCVECGRGFYTKRDMDVHFMSDHGGVKDFGCRMCGNKYGTKKALMRHELRVHKRDKMAKGRIPLYLQEEYRKPNEEIL